MTKPQLTAAPRRSFVATSLVASLAALTAMPLVAQTAASRPVDAATLAKYDANKNGRIDTDEQARLDADQRAAAGAVSSTATAPGDEVVSMTPFEVVSDAKGYYASNTMSGTRFNTKLEDLASSITVVTKEQMADFGMLDINDVFLYTAGTEGTGTFTDFTIDRNGSVSENVSLNPTGANRVRGIGAANVSLGNFETMGRTPVDPTVLDAVEVNRGPNANVFGLGSPSGTVNQIVAAASTTRNRTQFQLRGDDWGGYRSTLDINRVIKQGVLAFRVSGGFQHDAYTRKPSGQNSIRYNGFVRFQPFKKTRINANYLFFRQNGNRPNASPPRDGISYWIAQGRPTWDPVNQVVHRNGQTLGPFTTDVAPVTDWFNRSFTGSGRFYAYVGQNGLEYISPGTSTLNTNPGSGSGTLRLQSVNLGAGIVAGRPSGQPLFTTTPSVSDKSIYNWEDINLAAINRYYDRSATMQFSVDQNVIDSPMQRLDIQLAAMREDSKRIQRITVGELNANGQSGQLLIDPNERNLDGSVNAFYLRPYIGIDQPFTLDSPQRWDTYRAQLAYQLNFTKEQGFIKWLGMHQLTGYDEYKYRVNRRYSYKDGITSNHAWIPAGASRVNQGAITGGTGAAANITRGYWRYYLGDANGNNIDYAPGDFSYGTYNFRYGNPTNGFVSEPIAITQAATTDRAGAGNNSLTIIKTAGGLVQSHFWNGRIVTTFGRRQDRQLVRQGSSPQRLNADGSTFDYSTIDHWAPNYRSNRFGKTEQNGVVLKPFRGWSHIDQLAAGGGAARFLGEALRGLTFHYNESNSFTPADPRFSLFLEELENPNGKGNDKGFSVTMLDNRVVLKVNWWKTQQLANRNGDAGTIAQRSLRHDVASNAAFLLETQATAWVQAANPTWTATQVDTEVSRQMGLTTELRNTLRDYFNAGLISSTNDRIAEGTEIELNFNPTNFWTVAANATETQQFNQNVSADVQQWLNQRLPIWTTIRDPRIGATGGLAPTAGNAAGLWWNQNYGGSQTAAQNYATFIGSPFNVIKQQEGTADPQVRRYNFRLSTNYKLRGVFSDHKWLKDLEVGGAVRWEDKAAIGFYGIADAAGVYTALDPRRPIYEKAHTYFDLNLRYRTRLWANKVGASFQLNVRNLAESGRLQPIGAYPDGTPNTYRIVDPRQFILTATFDL